MLNIVLTGSNGRMGQRVARLIEAAPDLALAAGIDVDAHLQSVIERAQVVVDFTSAAAAVHHAEVAAAARVPIVIGTTGLDPSQQARVVTSARSIPIVFAPNMAIGVNVLWRLIELAAQALAARCDIDIEETHHVHKIDRPSGTALKMLEALRRGCDELREREVVHLEDDTPWQRAAGDHRISLRSVRRGEVVGDHTISFVMAGERFTLEHHAEDRDIFAEGALAAARWVVGKPAGLYGMDDVLGL
jgi:4-hydroxy-tetrahydrodipicolinate reductase